MNHNGICKCGTPLTKETAYPSKHSPSGLQSKCKACDRAWARKRNSSEFRSGREDHDGAGVGRKLPARTLCKKCCGLPHRVEGEICKCGLRRADKTAEETT